MPQSHLRNAYTTGMGSARVGLGREHTRSAACAPLIRYDSNSHQPLAHHVAGEQGSAEHDDHQRGRSF